MWSAYPFAITKKIVIAGMDAGRLNTVGMTDYLRAQ